MVKVAVFDSGLGSLSIIKAIQRVTKTNIIYFADQQNYPYGNKSKAQLESIINKTITMLQERFSPNLIVMASNTPSLMLNISNPIVIDVKPPLCEAFKASKSKKIGILGTRSAIKSSGLTKYINDNNNIAKFYKIFKINGSDLVDLVESGMFITNKQHCKKIINETLTSIIRKNSIDTITLSSTHLPFLKPLLENVVKDVQFIDPSYLVAERVSKIISSKQLPHRNSLKIFTSSDPIKLERTLSKLNINTKVSSI